MQLGILKRNIAFLLVVTLALSGFSIGLALPYSAHAETTEIEAVPSELQTKVEQTASDYDQAVAKVESLEKQIDDTATKIAELETAIPEQQIRSDNAVKALYKLNQEGFTLVNLVLDSGSLDEFLATIEYINHVQQSNVDEINRLKTMKDELSTSRETLESSKQEADAEKVRAQDALNEAQAAREEAQQKAIADAQASEAAAAAQASAQQQEQQEAQDTGSSDENVVLMGSDDVDWSTDKITFVNEWEGRINAYLAGSSLSGQGRAFAVAAWNYGVDPRWSPAISNTESSKGSNCFLPYNAWGWGSVSWSSWDEAIDAHVRGLARGYGYTISPEAAQKYCPPNWEKWYNNTLAQMQMI